MAKRRPQAQPEARRPKNLTDGQRTYQSGGKVILTHSVGALPIINRLLKRMRLQEFLQRHLPPEDNRTKVDTPRVVLLLLKNLLVSREPVYGVAEWACNFGPELFDLWPEDLQHLNDDRVGRCTERMFQALDTNLIMDVVTHVIQEFDVCLDELHLRVRPQFNSVLYGTPDYAQLADRCVDEIRRGAEDQSEMGVFHDLYQPQRAENLRARLDEYTPPEVDAGLVYIT